MGAERIDEVTEALRSVDGCSHEQLTWASALVMVEENDLAMALARKALRLEPSDIDALGLLLTGLFHAERYEEFLEESAGYLEREPDDAHIHALAGWAHGKLGHRDAMVAELEKALELAPDDLEPRRSIVQALIEDHESERAIVHLRALVERVPETDLALSMLGALLYERGRVEEAEETLRRAVESDVADMGMAALALGRLYAGQQRYVESLGALEAAKAELGELFPDQDLLDYVIAQTSGGD
jgi:tetratricopeptide (TPR) repeat protein